jgi:hypothetical protein
MNCPKCDPGAQSKRWVWWSLVGMALLIAAWIEHAGSL